METFASPRVWSCLQCRRTYITRSNPAPVLPPDWVGVRMGDAIEPFCSLDCVRQYVRAQAEHRAA